MALFPSRATSNVEFVARAVPGYRNLGSFAIALGGTSRIKLDPVGLITSLFLDINLNVSISVAAAVASKMAPYNILKTVRLIDDQGVVRIDAPGHHIWALNSVRKNSLEYRDTGVMFSSPSVPTAIGAQSIRFFLDIPISYSDKDLRGAIRGDVVGDIYLNIDWGDLLVNAGDSDVMYTGGPATAVTLTNGSVSAFQRYLQSSDTIPQEVQQVHYIEGGLRISDGIVPNTEKLINYPINRSTIAVAMTYVNNGAMNATDVSQVRFLTGPSELLRFSADEMYAIQRDRLRGASLPENFFFLSHDSLITTRFARANQIGFTPAAATVPGNTYIGVTFESFS